MSPADGKLAAASAGVADAGTVPGRTPRRLQLPVGPDGATAQGRPAGAPKQEKRRSTGAAAVAARDFG